MTINKSQGQTFLKVGIFLPEAVFAHGQLYVACSRARSFSDIYVQIENTFKQQSTGETALTLNIVYPDVILTS